MTEERLIELYRDNDPWMRELAARHIGCQQTGIDIAANIWVKVIAGQIMERREKSIKIVLYCCVMNAVKDYWRKEKARLRYIKQIDHQVRAYPATFDFDGDAMMKLKQLPDNRRQAIELIVLQGWKAVDAAKELGISVDALRMRLHHGLAWLRKMVVV